MKITPSQLFYVGVFLTIIGIIVLLFYNMIIGVGWTLGGLVVMLMLRGKRKRESGIT